jgi:hypothetical protein
MSFAAESEVSTAGVPGTILTEASPRWVGLRPPDQPGIRLKIATVLQQLLELFAAHRAIDQIEELDL